MKISVKAKHENNGGKNGHRELNSRCHKKERKKRVLFGFYDQSEVLIIRSHRILPSKNTSTTA